MKKTESLVVFDVLGPAYHYDDKGWAVGAADPLLDLLEKHGYHGSNDAENAENEERLQRVDGVVPLIMPGFVETVQMLKKYPVKSVVVSAGTPWILENAIDLAAKEYRDRTGISVNPEEL